MSCALSLPLANMNTHLNPTHTFLCRKSKAPIGSSALSQPSMPGHGVHWDVSQTRASATNFSIGSGSAVQRSGASMNSVGTHLGSSSGQGLVSATYSPLSHQGSLLRKDVDNQKNLRQADLNSVKRTPLSLKVGSLCCSSCPSASCHTMLKAKEVLQIAQLNVSLSTPMRRHNTHQLCKYPDSKQLKKPFPAVSRATACMIMFGNSARPSDLMGSMRFWY